MDMLSLFKRKPDPLLAQMAVAIERLTVARAPSDEPMIDPKETVFALIERQDSIENRFEELRGTVLRHLQMSSQRLNMAERKEEEAEDEGLPLPQLPGVIAPSNETENDLAYATRVLRENGISPI